MQKTVINGVNDFYNYLVNTDSSYHSDFSIQSRNKTANQNIQGRI